MLLQEALKINLIKRSSEYSTFANWDGLKPSPTLQKLMFYVGERSLTLTIYAFQVIFRCFLSNIYDKRCAIYSDDRTIVV